MMAATGKHQASGSVQYQLMDMSPPPVFTGPSSPTRYTGQKVRGFRLGLVVLGTSLLGHVCAAPAGLHQVDLSIHAGGVSA